MTSCVTQSNGPEERTIIDYMSNQPSDCWLVAGYLINILQHHTGPVYKYPRWSHKPSFKLLTQFWCFIRSHKRIDTYTLGVYKLQVSPFAAGQMSGNIPIHLFWSLLYFADTIIRFSSAWNLFVQSSMEPLLPKNALPSYFDATMLEPSQTRTASSNGQTPRKPITESQPNLSSSVLTSSRSQALLYLFRLNIYMKPALCFK